jgi:hypothetical protein
MNTLAELEKELLEASAAYDIASRASKSATAEERVALNVLQDAQKAFDIGVKEFRESHAVYMTDWHTNKGESV